MNYRSSYTPPGGVAAAASLVPASWNGGQSDDPGWAARIMSSPGDIHEDRFLDLGLDRNESSCLAEWGLMHPRTPTLQAATTVPSRGR